MLSLKGRAGTVFTPSSVLLRLETWQLNQLASIGTDRMKQIGFSTDPQRARTQLVEFRGQFKFWCGAEWPHRESTGWLIAKYFRCVSVLWLQGVSFLSMLCIEFIDFKVLGLLFYLKKLSLSPACVCVLLGQYETKMKTNRRAKGICSTVVPCSSCSCESLA